MAHPEPTLAGVIWAPVVAALAGYGIGTFPSAALVGRAVGHDPTREGSGNPGATNMYRVAGRGAGAMVALADVAKGAVAAGVGFALAGLADTVGRPAATAGWLAAAVGHIAPVTRRFRGGKGVATAGGGGLVLHPLVALGAIGAFFLVSRLTRKVSLASLVVMVGAPVAIALSGRALWEPIAAAALAALVIARHRTNIVRLVRGTESDYRRPT